MLQIFRPTKIKNILSRGETMNRQRTVVSSGLLAVLLFPFVTCHTHAQTIDRPKHDLRVFDSNNRFIGNVISIANNSPTVAFKVEGTVFTLNVSKTTFQGGAGPYFATTDCTGTPYIRIFDNFYLFPQTFVFNSGLVLLEDTRATPQAVFINSGLGEGEQCFSGPPFLDPQQVRPMTELTSFSQFLRQFTPPYSVREAHTKSEHEEPESGGHDDSE
jgi:hypothetical protein